MRFLMGLIIGATVTVLLAPRFAALGNGTRTFEAPFPAAVDEVLQAVAQAVDDPGTQTADPEPIARESLPLPVLAATPAVTTTTVATGLRVAANEGPEPPASAETAGAFAPPMLTEISQEQTVWVPFRSEASARGFAGKLTEQLERPFQVLRAGPGQYLVVFGYQSEPERNDVLDQIRALTGYVQL